MGLLDDIELPVRNLPCRVRTVIGELEKSDQKILTDLVMNNDWPVQTLEIALRKKGVNLSGSTIRKHRSRNCSCWKN